MGVSSDSVERRWNERFPLTRVHWGIALSATLAMWLAAWWLRANVDNALPPGLPFVTFFPVVIVVSFLFGARVGVVAAILCGLTAWFEFLPPLHSWKLDRGSIVAMGFYAFITGTEILLIHWMQRSNRRLESEREANAQLAHTRELLFRELQHRVSNNLQMTAGLINLQRRNVSDEAAKSALEEAARRLDVIGRISRQLYRSDGTPLAMGQFIDQLATDVVDASGRDDVSLSVSVERDAALDPQSAIPVALIVAEAVANSIEHGFAGQRGGQVAIRLRNPSENVFSVEVEDNGRGLPENFDIDDNPSLGLQIARLLARQIGGSFQLSRPASNGALARLEMPLPA